MQMLQKSHSSKKPIILITTSNVDSPKLGSIIGDTDIAYADKATAQTIIKAGGIPLYVPSFQSSDLNDLEVYIELADGLVLTGARKQAPSKNPIAKDGYIVLLSEIEHAVKRPGVQQ